MIPRFVVADSKNTQRNGAVPNDFCSWTYGGTIINNNKLYAVSQFFAEPTEMPDQPLKHLGIVVIRINQRYFAYWILFLGSSGHVPILGVIDFCRETMRGHRAPLPAFARSCFKLPDDFTSPGKSVVLGRHLPEPAKYFIKISRFESYVSAGWVVRELSKFHVTPHVVQIDPNKVKRSAEGARYRNHFLQIFRTLWGYLRPRV